MLKALLYDSAIDKHGEWLAPPIDTIGYLDQQYLPLTHYETVVDSIQFTRPSWDYGQVRIHLNHFLFPNNEQVYAPIKHFSGGESARLSLAIIAAKPPKLLILDEITNNLDIQTKAHVLSLLKAYPGPFIIVSHDEDFLQQLDLTGTYNLSSPPSNG